MTHLSVVDNKYLIVRCDFSEKTIVKQTGGIFDKRLAAWIMPFTQHNVEFLIDNLPHVVKEDGFDEELIKQIDREERLEKIRKMAKADKPVQFKIAGLKDGVDLFNYQKLGVLFALTTNNGILLADDMGLGKCLGKKSNIYTKQGAKEAEVIFNKYANIDTEQKDSDGGLWYDLNTKLELLSEGNKFQDVKKIYREKVLNISKILLEDGIVRRTGLNHKFLTPRKGFVSAKDLKVNDWVGVVSSINVPETREISLDLLKLLAYQIAEGHEKKKGYGLSLTQKDVSVLKSLKVILDSFNFKKSWNLNKNIKVTISYPNRKVSIPYLRISSKQYVYFLKELGYEFGHLSGTKFLPSFIKNCQLEGASHFLRHFFDAEGSCSGKDNIEVSSKSKQLMLDVSYMLKRFGIFSILSKKMVLVKKERRPYWRLHIGGIYARKFYKEIGFEFIYKQAALKKLCEKKCNTNIGYSIPCKELLQELLILSNLSRRVLGIASIYIDNSGWNPSVKSVKNIIFRIDTYLKNGIPNITNNKWIERNIKSKELWNKNKYKIIEIRNKLDELSNGNITWLKIKDKKIKKYEEYIYDFEMEEKPNYVFDYVIGHNTVQSLAVSLYKKNKEGIKNCLIVTLASLKWNWPKEIEKFTNEKYIVIDGTPEERINQWRREDVFFYITNYETIIEDLFGGKNIKIKETDSEEAKEKKEKRMANSVMRANSLRKIKERVYGCIVLDEIHAIKSHESRRAKCCKMLKADFKIGLSGTPLDGKLEELHSLFEFIHPGLFECKTLFLQKHAVFDYMGNIVNYKHVNTVKERIKPFFLRRLKSEVLKDLPDIITQNRYVVLNSKEKKIYDEIANGVHEITTDAEAMQIIIRCKQFCDHPDLIGLNNNEKSSKLESFKEIIDELIIQNGAKVLVFSQYSSMCRILIKTIEEMKLKYLYIWGGTDKKLRAEMQEQFNTDKTIDLMIGTDAMSTGLNLTGASYVINYDDFWSPSIMDQRSGRAHRLGQKNTVNVINFICKDTIEERIRDVLYHKSKISSDVLGDMTDEIVLKRLGPKDIAKLL